MIKSREMRWMRGVACMGQKWNAYRSLVGKPTGKEILGRPRLKWENYIKMRNES
jgi:hypothetical protein